MAFQLLAPCGLPPLILIALVRSDQGALTMVMLMALLVTVAYSASLKLSSEFQA